MDATTIRARLRNDGFVILSDGDHVLGGDLIVDFPGEIRGAVPARRGRGARLRGGRIIVTSDDARLTDLALIGPGRSADALPCAVEVHAIAELTSVRVFDWPGRGFTVSASAASTGTDASRTRLTRCQIALGAEHGFVIEGADANAVLLDQCDARDLKGVGFYDLSFLGTVFQACMAHACETAGYSNDVRLDPKGQRVNANQSSLFLGCYCEGDSKIRVGKPGIWVGAMNSKMEGNGLWLNGTSVRFPMLIGARVQDDAGKTWDLDKSLAAGKLVP